MSAPPGTTNPAPSNTNTLLLGGVIVGMIVLCGGLFAQSLITLNIVTRHADYAFKAGATQPGNGSYRPATRADTGSGTDPGDDNPGAVQVARGFLKDLQTTNYGAAYARTSDGYKNQEDQKEFRERMESAKIFRGYQSLNLTRQLDGKAGFVTFRGFVKGPYGEGRFVLLIAQESDGSWKVDSFGKE